MKKTTRDLICYFKSRDSGFEPADRISFTAWHLDIRRLYGRQAVLKQLLKRKRRAVAGLYSQLVGMERDMNRLTRKIAGFWAGPPVDIALSEVDEAMQEARRRLRIAVALAKDVLANSIPAKDLAEELAAEATA